MKNRHVNKEYKLIHIILGLAIGFFLGGVIVYIGFNRQNVSLLSLDILPFQITESIHNEDTSLIRSGDVDKARPDSAVDKKEHSGGMNQIVENKQLLDKTYDYHDSILKHNLADNEYLSKQGIIDQIEKDKHDLFFLFDTFKLYVSQPETDTDDSRVAKDRLVYVKTLENPIKNSNQAIASYDILDSILGKHSSPSDQSTIIVEFWETPLSSKGYIKSKNKLILYGVSLHNFATLKYYDETVYLKYLNQYYPLQFTSEYKSLKPLSDLKLIEHLQQL